MDEIATRLKETSETCLKALEAWGKDKKDNSAKEALAEAIHELRKASARVEIEMAVSDSQGNGKAIPIPSHRSSRGGNKGNDSVGNAEPQEGGQKRSSGPRRRRSGGKNE